MKIQGIQLKQLDRPTYISIPTLESAQQLEDFLFSKKIFWHSSTSKRNTTPRLVLGSWYKDSLSLVMALDPSYGKLHLSGRASRNVSSISLKEFMDLQKSIRRY